MLLYNQFANTLYISLKKDFCPENFCPIKSLVMASTEGRKERSVREKKSRKNNAHTIIFFEFTSDKNYRRGVSYVFFIFFYTFIKMHDKVLFFSFCAFGSTPIVYSSVQRTKMKKRDNLR